MSLKQVLAGFIAFFVVLMLVGYWRRPKAPTAPTRGISTLAKKWEFATGGPIIGSLALSDTGTVYVASEDGFVYALTPYGAAQWSAYIGPTNFSPAIGTDGAIYVPNDNGRVFALNPSGTVRWNTEVGEDNSFSRNGAALSRDYLYMESSSYLCAIRLTTGEVEWKSFWGGDQWGSVTLLPDGTLLSPGHGRLNDLDSNGQVLWQYPALSADATKRNGGFPPPGDFFVGSGIAVGNNRTLYAAADRTRMVAMGMDGSPRWELNAPTIQANRSTPVVSADGTIFFGSGLANLYAVDPFGTTKWTLALQGGVLATPVLAQDGTIYVFNGHFLSAISPDGKSLSQVDLEVSGESSPTLAPDGTIYVANNNGKVFAFTGGHGGLMNSTWPKYQADLHNSGSLRSF